MTDAEVREIGNRSEWLAWRRHDLTASRIGALFGVHPYMTLDDLVADMRGQSAKGDTPAMRAGRLLEAVFPEALAEEKPEWKVTKATTYHRLADLRLGATPDFWIDDDGLLESKTVNEREWERWQGRPPLGYMLQTLAQLIVTGKKWGVLGLIVRSSSMPLYLWDVPRHEMAERKMLDAVATFWRRVDAGEFPTPTPKDEIAALLDDGSHKDLSEDNYLPEALERRESVIAMRREADRNIRDIDYEIKNRMGTASTAWLPGWQIAFRKEHRKGYTVEPSDPRILKIRRTAEDNNG